MRERLLGVNALNLQNTFYFARSYPKTILQRMAHGYAYPGGEFCPPVKPGSDMTEINMSVANAGGAMISNTPDLTRWQRDLFSGRVLAEKQLKEMMSAVCMGKEYNCHPGEPVKFNGEIPGFSLGLVYLYKPELGSMWVYLGGTAGYYTGIMWVSNRKIALAMAVSASSAAHKDILRTLGNIAKTI